MTTYILTWNADKWPWPDAERRSGMRRTQRGGLVKGQWSTGNRTHGIAPDDRAFLLQQGRLRGIVASGWFTSEVFQEPHWDPDRPDKTANYADVVWDVVLSDEDMVGIEEVKAAVPSMDWDRIQASGVRLTDDAEQELERLWSAVGGTFRSPEEVRRSRLREGALTQITVNRYERSPQARSACLAHYGTDCQACGLDFEARYGPMGQGFIHVHHVVDLAMIGKDYEVDPIADLRPVCPNCHAMLHTTTPALTVEELAAQIRAPR